MSATMTMTVPSSSSILAGPSHPNLNPNPNPSSNPFHPPYASHSPAPLAHSHSHGATPAARTQRLKAKLNAFLGKDAPQYWTAVTQFLTGRVMRQEMDAVLDGLLKGTDALALHNAFLLSILRTASLSPSALAALSLPPPGSSAGKKRKRLYPHQGDYGDEEDGGRSKRMREWVVGMGRQERERLKGLARAGGEEYRPAEVGEERGVRYIPGTAYSAHTLPSTLLATHTRALPAAQILQQRLASIALSRGLPGGVAPECVPLLTAALESHLKSLVSRGLSLTQRGLSFASIRTAALGPAQLVNHPIVTAAAAAAEVKLLPKKEKEKDNAAEQRPLGLQDVRTLLSIAPSELPAKTASTVRLAWNDPLPSEPAPTLPSLAAAQGTTTGSSRRDAAARQLERLLGLRSGVREEILRAVEAKEGFGPGSGSGGAGGAGDGAGGGGVEREARRWEEHDRVGEWIAAVV